jgi:predicted GTPase
MFPSLRVMKLSLLKNFRIYIRKKYKKYLNQNYKKKYNLNKNCSRIEFKQHKQLLIKNKNKNQFKKLKIFSLSN